MWSGCCQPPDFPSNAPVGHSGFLLLLTQVTFPCSSLREHASPIPKPEKPPRFLPSPSH